MKDDVGSRKPDRKKKIKRIIVREVLIFFGILVISVIVMQVGNSIIPKFGYGRHYSSPELRAEFILGVRINHIGTYLFFFGYPFCLFIRFIIWAVRTVREK